MASSKRAKRSGASATAAAVANQEGAGTAGNLAAAWPFPKAADMEQDHGSDLVERGASHPLPGEEARELPPMGERIRVDQVSLYTDPAKNTIERIAIEQLLESPFNPRKHFDEQGLKDLAETIRGVGVMQAILVRPVTLPGGVEISHGSEPVQAFEIVFGHRRFRASQIAGETHLPAIVRELTDLQSAQLQAIENVQRKDLNAVEEALGYKQYIDTHGVSKDQLADEIGLSRTHVYNRLKLLNAVTPVLDALRAGEIGSEVAHLIARIHSPRLQEKALASLKSNHHQLEEGGKHSYRSIKHFLKEKFTLKLKEAVFPTDDATLLEGADACTTCPKRSGNATEYADIVSEEGNSYTKQGADLCTDPECWEAKHKQHLVNQAAALEAKGKTVITGARARQAIGADGVVKGAYIALKDVKGELAKAKKKGAEAPAVVVIQDPRNGKAVEAVRREDVKAVGVKVKDAPKQAGRYDYEEEARKRREQQVKDEAKAKEVRRLNYAILGAVRGAAAGQPLSAEAVHLVAQVALDGVAWEDKPAMCSLYGANSWEALLKTVASMPADRLTTLLLDCALVKNVNTVGHTLKHKPDTLMWAAGHYGVDVEEIRSDLAKARAPDTATQELPLDEDQVDEELEEGAEA